MRIYSIGELLNSTQQYIIPIYQRNYAWTEVEITQLLTDIQDKACEAGNYYIGTLTIDESRGNFYIIDGQQRFTTLTLINAVGRGKYNVDTGIPLSNLRFDAREDTYLFMATLFSDYHQAQRIQSEDGGIAAARAAVKTIEAFFHGWKKEALDSYFKYFRENVKIIELGVPEGTDINHYFEVMNNRGEQLEQHEILKAAFLSVFREQPDAYRSFSEIWDACSHMDKPVQQSFISGTREGLFGADLSYIPRDVFVPGSIIPATSAEVGSHGPTLLSLLQDGATVDVYKEETPVDSKYRAIIDFPNFLLQVRSLQKMGEGSLDDKKLLSEFGYPYNMPDAVSFINDLLYYRVLFDRYIIKREEANNDWKWRLIKPVKDEEQVRFVRTFEDQPDVHYVDFVMVQSMLHVAYPGNSNKRWLQEVLMYLGEKGAVLQPGDYFIKLEAIAAIAANSIISATGGATEFSGYHQGTHTPRLLFYYLDYLLWKRFRINAEGDLFLNLDDTAKKKFRNFRFTQNNSVEHVAPQRPGSSDFDPEERLHDFGNLCLISSSANSRMINLTFKAKRDYFLREERAESLKQVLIFCHPEWSKDTIERHGKKMISVIVSAITANG